MQTLLNTEAERNLAIAESIAKALKGYVIEQTCDWYIVISVHDIPLGLRIGGYGNNGRIEVRPDYPTYRNEAGNHVTVQQRIFDRDCKYNDPQFTGIGVSETKKPELIAKDIERRFLSVYRPLYAKAMQYCQEQRAYYSKTALVTVEVNQVFNGLKNVYVTSISPDNIRLDCLFSPTRAVLVAQFLKNLGDD